MPAGERFIRLSAAIDDDPRIVRLPSDSARWAWIITLTKGKYLSTPGEWESEEHLAAQLRRRGKFVPTFLELGLLERNGNGSIHVRNWSKWQTDPTAKSRQDRHRGKP